MTSEELNTSLEAEISEALQQYIERNPDDSASRVTAGLAAGTQIHKLSLFLFKRFM